MWCSHCRTQVAGIAGNGGAADWVCAKCQHELASADQSPLERSESAGLNDPGLGMRLDFFRMQATLDRVDRLVERLQSASMVEFDPQAHFEEETTSHPSRSADVRQNGKDEAGMPWLAMLSLSGGVMLLVCGGLLTAMSGLAGRPELFSIGFPLSVVALAMMALASCLYFQHHASNQARTQDHLNEVAKQLGGIQQVAQRSRHSLGSIPSLPVAPVEDRLTEADHRLKMMRKSLQQAKNLR